MKKIFLVLFVLTLQTCFAQSGWFWQNPKPTGGGFCDAAYIDANTIYALGATGEFLKSGDAGLTWNTKSIIIQTGFSTRTFIKMSVVNAQNIFALAVDTRTPLSSIYRLYKSTDAGNQWSEFLIDSVSHSWFNDLKFTNINTGYSFNNFNSYDGHIFKTTDGGQSWNLLTINGTDTLYALSFPGENTGFICGPSKKIFKTTNAGSNWISYNLPSGTSNYEQTFFLNENTGWILTPSRIFKTVNGGINFTNLGSTPGIASGYGFFDGNTGYGYFNGFYRTTNSGQNWTAVDIRAYRLNILNSTTGLITGAYGEISKTTNSGFNWTQLSLSAVPVSNSVNKISFTDQNYGWAAAGNRLLKTTNGGTQWITQPDTSKLYSSVKFIDQNTGVFSAYGGIYLSTSSGNNWNIVTGPEYSNYNFLNLSMTAPDTWYCIGKEISTSATIILKTTNGGSNWQSANSPSQFLLDISFTDANTGFVTFLGGIYKTTNGGSNWNLLTSTSASTISFINSNTGWYLYSGKIYKTTNGGINFQQVYNGGNLTLNCLKFANALTGWLLAYDGSSYGKILKTTDGGQTFFYNNYASSKLYDIAVLNENTVWVCGENGAILKTTTGGTIGIHQISASLPDKFYLEQNYPNPFNPNSNIVFSLPQNTFVKLNVFDLLGREVANLVNEKLSAGKYKYDFNASLLPSGIYFYKLETESFSETKKMVLVK
ncbi:MAG: T9SS type A sorting domain-containing protein [Bacteroidetes bacterium]|nr:T9SS type A sorting domain-containing protein [Bacteroidota bacterium]